MRLFFALWPDAGVQGALAESARVCHRVCGGRGLPAERLHVTVAFLGEVQTERYNSLVAIGASIDGAAFELHVDQLGFWPQPRIVYAAASQVPTQLEMLARCLTEQLSAAGFRTDKRVFVPHVTLLRDAKRAPRGVEFAPLRWRVDTLRLVETLRADGKLAYQTRECWTLTK